MVGKLHIAVYVGQGLNSVVAVKNQLNNRMISKGLLSLPRKDYKYIFDMVRTNWADMAKANDWLVDILEGGEECEWVVGATKYFQAAS